MNVNSVCFGVNFSSNVSLNFMTERFRTNLGPDQIRSTWRERGEVTLLFMEDGSKYLFAL